MDKKDLRICAGKRLKEAHNKAVYTQVTLAK